MTGAESSAEQLRNPLPLFVRQHLIFAASCNYSSSSTSEDLRDEASGKNILLHSLNFKENGVLRKANKRIQNSLVFFLNYT